MQPKLRFSNYGSTVPVPTMDFMGSQGLSFGSSIGQFGNSSSNPTTSSQGGFSAPTVVNPETPQTPEAVSFWQRMGLATEDGNLNMDAVGNLAEVLGSFGMLYQGFQQNQLAREALDMKKKAYATNLRNQLQSYNTAISDRAYARAAQNNADASSAEAYIAANRLRG